MYMVVDTFNSQVCDYLKILTSYLTGFSLHVGYYDQTVSGKQLQDTHASLFMLKGPGKASQGLTHMEILYW